MLEIDPNASLMKGQIYTGPIYAPQESDFDQPFSADTSKQRYEAQIHAEYADFVEGEVKTSDITQDTFNFDTGETGSQVVGQNTTQTNTYVLRTPDEFGIVANTTYDYSPYDNAGNWAKLGKTDDPAGLEIMGEKTADAQLEYSGYFNADAADPDLSQTQNYHRDDYTNILYLDGHVGSGSMNEFQQKANGRYTVHVRNDPDNPLNWKTGTKSTNTFNGF